MALILMFIAHPSFSLLYILDEVISPTMTIKAVGPHWYWSFPYEYTDYETESGDVIEYDSYMIPESDLELGQLRLLDVDSSGINKSGLMLVLRKMRDTYIKYIPENLRVIIKWLFRILLIIFIIFNFLGFEGVFNILRNNYYIKLFCYISCSLSICYEILNLHMLHRFINKNINISSVLPAYIIDLLKELENISSDIESINYFKKTCYIHILLYIIPIIMVTLIF